jgi:hypothetical protein
MKYAGIENEDVMKHKNTATTYEEAWNVKLDDRTSEELYDAIVNDIRTMYDGKLSEIELHEAARNLTEFYKKLIS